MLIQVHFITNLTHAVLPDVTLIGRVASRVRAGFLSKLITFEFLIKLLPSIGGEPERPSSTVGKRSLTPGDHAGPGN